MGLEVLKGKSVRSYENTFFRKFAIHLTSLFEKYSFDGLLIGFPHCKYNDKLELDAILITTNAILIIEFKNYVGTVKLPPAESFKKGKWSNQKSNNKKGINIKGGSYENPYEQLNEQKAKLSIIIEKYIKDKLPKHDKLNPKHAINVVCFQNPIECIGKIPLDVAMNFTIAGSHNFKERIMDFIHLKDTEVKLSEDAFSLFKEIFIAASYDLYERYEIISDNTSLVSDASPTENDKNEKGELIPLEPDFLFDVSELANCFSEINKNEYAIWQRYFVTKLSPLKLNIPVLLGKVINECLDMIIQSQKSNGHKGFKSHLKKTFIKFPLEYIALLKDKRKSQNFYQRAKQQYENLVSIVEEDFKERNVGISLDNVHLEPTFINKEMGLQGRIDLLYIGKDTLRIIELKSGKPPFPAHNKKKLNPGHVKQGQMYSLLVDNKKMFNHIEKRNIVAILYSSIERTENTKHSNLRWVSLEGKHKIYNNQNNKAKEENLTYKDEIISLRNKVIKSFKQVINSEDDTAIDSFLKALSFTSTGVDLGGNENLEWMKSDYNKLENNIKALSVISKSYFFAYFRFLLQEKFNGKVGDGQFDFGQSGAWKEESLSTMSDKIMGLEIANAQDVIIEETSFDIKLSMDEKEGNNKWSDFRVGDLCMIYKQENSLSNVTDGQLFKCVVGDIKPDSFTLHFRHKPSDTSIKSTFRPKESKWAMVHDYLDTTNRQMMQSIGYFINLPKEEQSLILGVEKPKYRKKYFDLTGLSENDFNENADANIERQKILSSILSSQDYYLLCGPPGTGKTNIIIKQLTKYFINKTDERILVLAYTNRAVDEICNAIINAFGDKNTSNESDRNYQYPFIRIGSKHNAEERYQKYILASITKQVHLDDTIKYERAALKTILKENRIYVSTISSMYINTTLIDIVGKFNTCIVDEASQILEPLMIGLYNMAERLVLIGDEKQLPAISRQPKEYSKRFNKEVLKEVYMEDLSHSYFERMLRNAKRKQWHHCFGTLTLQARMHQGVADFVNKHFYEEILKPVGLNHQKESSIHQGSEILHLPDMLKDCSEQLLTQRVVFIDTPLHEDPECLKANPIQAQITARIVHFFGDFMKEETEEKVGIITLFRSQISMIKSKMLVENKLDSSDNTIKEQATNIDYDKILVDTVERFQGSQKDFIIINMSVNTTHQLDFLKANTSEMLSKNNSTFNIDKKLNVALTRAKKQVIILGNEELLSKLPIYEKLINFVKDQGGYIASNALINAVNK